MESRDFIVLVGKLQRAPFYGNIEITIALITYNLYKDSVKNIIIYEIPLLWCWLKHLDDNFRRLPWHLAEGWIINGNRKQLYTKFHTRVHRTSRKLLTMGYTLDNSLSIETLFSCDRIKYSSIIYITKNIVYLAIEHLWLTKINF